MKSVKVFIQTWGWAMDAVSYDFIGLFRQNLLKEKYKYSEIIQGSK